MRGDIIIVDLIEECKKQNPCEVIIRYDEPMKEHTTFKTGGPADCYVCPSGEGFTSFCAGLLNLSKAAEIPLFILGGGANIVVSDKGIRGIVLDTSSFRGEVPRTWNEECSKDASEEETLIFKSGTALDEAANTAASKSLSGLEFLAGMPGTVGGAVWMNARCYGKEMADVLKWAEIAVSDRRTANGEYVVRKLEINDKKIPGSQLPVPDSGFSIINSFDYKYSPFQKMDCLIFSAAFNLLKGDKDRILTEMARNRQDRQEKGHYLFPCAGSVFKNNRGFGKPTGQIIDEFGLKGLQTGGAQIAPFHGNFIINTGNACAADIRALVDEVTKRIKAAAGFTLETEILFVGE